MQPSAPMAPQNAYTYFLCINSTRLRVIITVDTRLPTLGERRDSRGASLNFTVEVRPRCMEVSKTCFQNQREAKRLSLSKATLWIMPTEINFLKWQTGWKEHSIFWLELDLPPRLWTVGYSNCMHVLMIIKTWETDMWKMKPFRTSDEKMLTIVTNDWQC